MKLAQHPRATAEPTLQKRIPVLVRAHAVLAELEKSSKPKHETPRAVSLPTLLVVPPDVPSRMSEMERKPLAWADHRWQASGDDTCICRC